MLVAVACPMYDATMRTMKLAVVTAYLTLLGACTDTATEPTNVDDSEGIPALGIGRVEITDNAQETTVVGYSADTNDVVARMTLVHGRFTLTGPFREESDTAEVDGRKLDVEVLGQQLLWESGGYSPALHMPSHPASQNLLSTFLEAPQVKPILEHWLIGFDGASAGDESPYGTGSFSGTNVTNCDGLATCGTVHTVNINTCGNSNVFPTYARKANTSASEQKLAQCCPPVTGVLDGATPWFATKTCPVSTVGNCDPDGTGPLTTADGTMSECGCVKNTLACKACANYPAPFDCSVTSNASSVSYSFSDARLVSFTGFTFNNGASTSGARIQFGGSGYPTNPDIRYPTNSGSAYYRTSETISISGFINTGKIQLNGWCNGVVNFNFVSCTIPAGSSNASFNAVISPF